MLRCDLARCLQGTVVYGLEDLDVEFLGFGRVEWRAKCHECIGKPLNVDGTMTEVRSTCFRDKIVVDIYDTAKIKGDVFGDGVEFIEVIFSVFDVGWQSEAILYGCFVGGRVLDNFGAEIGRFDGADILLV
jgi:hypothetical protein